jgi:hypothetical protein
MWGVCPDAVSAAVDALPRIATATYNAQRTCSWSASTLHKPESKLLVAVFVAGKQEGLEYVPKSCLELPLFSKSGR